MKSTMSAIGLSVAIAAGSAAGPASAQYAPTTPTPMPTGTGAQEAPAEAPAIAPSRGAHKAILALQEAVNANDTANIPARLAAAEAAAKTAEDRYLIAGMRYKAAVAANDNAGKAAALEALIASGLAQPQQLPGLYGELANAYIATQQKDRAAAAIERLIAVEPNNVQAAILLANTRKEQGRAAEGVALLQKSIASAAARGRADERLYQHAVQMAYDARLPVAIDLSRQWVAAYPTSENWRNALRIYRNLERPPESILIDLLRLGRAVNALDGTVDYHPYAYAAIEDRTPAEAKAVVEQGIAAGKIDGSEKLYRDILAEATTKSAGQRERLPALSSDARASSTASMAITAANIHYGYGNYAEAAELYRAALGKSGADKDLVNLRLGMALARAGDKAGATAALNAVTGARAQIAKYWLTYLQTRA